MKRNPTNGPDTVDDLEHFQGCCRYCGQLHVVVPVIDNPSQDQLDEMATLSCDCSEARRYQMLKESINRASDNIKKLINNEEAKKIMLAAVGPVASYDIASISINDGMGTTYSLKMGKDKIKLTKTKTSKETAE